MSRLLHNNPGLYSPESERSVDIPPALRDLVRGKQKSQNDNKTYRFSADKKGIFYTSTAKEFYSLSPCNKEENLVKGTQNPKPYRP